MATMATGLSMGQQVHEEQLFVALSRELPDGWGLTGRRIGSLRSPFEDARRMPLRAVGHLPLPAQRLVGRIAYGPSDLVHRMDLRIPPGPKAEVLTVHDLGSMRFPDEGVLPVRARQSVHHAQLIVTVSEFSAEEIERAFGVARPVVIPNGVDPRLHDYPAATDAELAALGTGPRFVLHLGGATERKNLAGLAGAWALLAAERPDLHLVLCGPSDLRRTALFEGLPRCRMPGHVDVGTRVGLMRRAAVVVVPSVYEGFGLPAIEAMALGTPVVAVRRGALPEVCGEHASLVEPDPGAIAEGLAAALDDPGNTASITRARAHAAQFTWERAARAHLALYRAVLDE